MGRGVNQAGRADDGQDPFRQVVAVLMAGGAGTRFWPLSTPDLPKQFLGLLTEKPLYVQATERASLLVPWNRVLVMTHAGLAGLVRDQSPHVPPANVILEPARRNTAAAIILAAVIIHHRWPGSTMVAMPTDHLIGDMEAFRQTLARAVARAREGGLGTIGIPPTYPSTEFGYLRLPGPPDGTGPVRIEQFVEKPDLGRARQCVASGRCLWNSGIFVWQSRVLLEAAARHLPQVYHPLAALDAVVDTEEFPRRALEVFEQIESVSVDYGIMEKADDLWAVPAAFSWNDVGNWLAAAELLPADADGNRLRGNVTFDQAHNNLVIGESSRPLLVVGLCDCIIVQGPYGTLVCSKSHVNSLKSAIERVLSGGA